jgi:hypothetical protein
MSETRILRRASVIVIHLYNLDFALEFKLALCSFSSLQLLVQTKEINAEKINVAIRGWNIFATCYTQRILAALICVMMS